MSHKHAPLDPKHLQVEQIPVSNVRPDHRNTRTHSKHQIRQVADSISCFGFVNPILIDEADWIIAGHARLEAANSLGLESVPVIRLNHLTTHQKRALAIADNKLALNAGWDEETLAIELQSLLATELDFDIGVTGFSIPEIDNMIEGLVPVEDGDPAEDTFPPDGPSVSQVGDLWLLGAHKVLCGDALKAGSYQALLGDERARMVFTDPPYNVPIDGHVCGSGAIKHREFIMAAGEMSPHAFTAFLETAFRQLAAFSCDGAIHFVCMDWRHMTEILAAGEATYAELKNLIIWVKDNGGMGSFYRSRHELIFAFKSGTAPHVNAFELGQHGRYRTNVWEYRGVNTLKSDRLDELALHPTVKPVAMIADAIKDVSKRGDIVLDAFGGSGSTLIAAHKTGRRGRLIELDPLYVDRIVRRWQVIAHDEAVLAETGQTFEDLARKRQIPAKEGDLVDA